MDAGIVALKGQVEAFNKDSRMEMRDAIVPMVEQFDKFGEFVDSTELLLKDLKENAGSLVQRVEHVEQQRLEVENIDGPATLPAIDVGSDVPPASEVEHAVRDMIERMDEMDARTQEELNNLEHGTKLAIDSMQAHIDQVEESMGETDVAFCAEFVVLHGVTNAIVEDISSVKDQMELRLKQMDFDYAMQLQHSVQNACEHKIDDLRTGLRAELEAAQVESSMEHQLMLAELGSRPLANIDKLSAKVSDLDVEVSLDHELMRAALDQDRRGPATATNKNDHRSLMKME